MHLLTTQLVSTKGKNLLYIVLFLITNNVIVAHIRKYYFLEGKYSYYFETLLSNKAPFWDTGTKHESSPKNFMQLTFLELHFLIYSHNKIINVANFTYTL